MLKSGLIVKAMRPPESGKGGPTWADVDITDLSTDEFQKWWTSIQSDSEKFYVAETLRRLSHNLSDFADSGAP